MRLLLLPAVLVALCSIRPAAAQQASSATASSSAGGSSDRIALSSRPEASNSSRRSMRLACAPLVGQVFEPNGRPLMGATLLIKGTHQVYVTDSEGKFQLTDPVYQGQEITVGAAGYISQDVALEDCSLPRLVLAMSPTAHIKRKGKRAGQVTRLNGRSTNMR